MAVFSPSLFVTRHFDSFLFLFHVRFLYLASLTVTTDDERTFSNFLGADKDKIPHDQTSGNYSKDAMLDSTFDTCQSTDIRNCNYIYVSFIVIIGFMFW